MQLHVSARPFHANAEFGMALLATLPVPTRPRGDGERCVTPARASAKETKLIEHCTGIVEVMGSNPVQACLVDEQCVNSYKVRKRKLKGPKTIAPTRFLTSSLMSNIRCGKRCANRCECNNRYGC